MRCTLAELPPSSGYSVPRISAVQVRRALAELPDEFRVVLVLREMEGLDYDTIAKILELPIGTVRSRLHRARLQLKEQLTLALEEGAKDR